MIKTLGFLACIFPMIGYAGTSATVTLNRVSPMDNGNVVLYANGGWGNVANNTCSNPIGVLAFDSTSPAGKTFLSTVLLALAAQKSVIVSTSDTTCTAVGGWALTVIRIDLLN